MSARRPAARFDRYGSSSAAAWRRLFWRAALGRGGKSKPARMRQNGVAVAGAGMGDMAKPALIEIDKVSKSFDGGATFAVRDATIGIEPGAFIAVVGTSGSGKTTTLKFINRLVEPDSGEVRIEGVRVGTIDAPTLRRRIGYVFQGIGLFPHMRVGENIGITPQLLGWGRPEIAARIEELLDLVGLPRSYASRFPDALSGGEAQRVSVARAIAAGPRIVLMDEPFGALDPVTRDALGSAYRQLHERLGLTTVMVTHDVQEAVLLADRIVVMSGGRVLAQGTPAVLMSGAADPAVAALMAMPRRQAARIASILERNGGESPGGEAAHG
jgi:osmoprotectant transport system ATP-binding protein